MSDRDPYREAGKISYVKAEDYRGEGGKPNTVWVGVDMDGTFQGFGGLCLEPKDIKIFLQELQSAFGVKNQEDLVGQKCYALRAFPTWNEPIWGIESVKTGRAVTLKTLRKAMGYPSPDRLEETKKSLESSISMHERRATEDRLALRKIHASYKDWDQ